MLTEEQTRKYHQPGANNNQALILAVNQSNLEVVKYLMTAKFENMFHRVGNRSKQAAFVAAASKGQLNIMKYLLKREFRKSLNLKEISNQAVKESIFTGQIEATKYLLNTLETKKHINIEANTEYYVRVAPIHMLEYLVFDYKLDISLHAERLRNDPKIINSRPDTKNFLNYYILQNQLSGMDDKPIRKKAKI